MRQFSRMLGTAMVAVGLTYGTVSAAGGYPERPIRMVVPFPAGGPTDGMARLIGQKLTESLGQQVVIDNRGGAGGAIAAELVAKSTPDGYTLLFGTTGTQAINPSLYKRLGYKPETDFVPVTMVATTSNVLLVNPELKVGSVKELIAQAKAKPGQLTYGSAGNGSSNHLSGELFKTLAGVDVVHIPYKGSAAATTDLLGGRLSFMFDTLGSGMPNVQAGKLKALAITASQRSSAAPDLSTLSEAGVPGYDLTIWMGILVPAGTSRDIVARLQAETAKALHGADLVERLHGMGADPVGNTPEAFAAQIKADTVKWGRIVKESGAQID